MDKLKKILVCTGGGDCPGLNAVIRGIVKRASAAEGYEVWGSYEAFKGIMDDPPRLVKLDAAAVAGIHVRGGTIIKTTNKGNPMAFPVVDDSGQTRVENRVPWLVQRIKDLGFHALINIGGDGSQAISQALHEAGLPVIGVPKTIDNDLSSTDFTFGFQTAVQTASDSFDRLVTTASSHHRVMIMEVMGRDAGWIALYTAISGGAEVCLIPEIPYRVESVIARIQERYREGRGFANVVVAEGAHPQGGSVTATEGELGRHSVRLGGVAYTLADSLRRGGLEADIRETVLGHTQRGGSPIAFDRVLASVFGVRAFELVLAQKWGEMVVYKNNAFDSVALTEVLSSPNNVNPSGTLVEAARGLGISFGDE